MVGSDAQMVWLSKIVLRDTVTHLPQLQEIVLIQQRPLQHCRLIQWPGISSVRVQCTLRSLLFSAALDPRKMPRRVCTLVFSVAFCLCRLTL